MEPHEASLKDIYCKKNYVNLFYNFFIGERIEKDENAIECLFFSEILKISENMV